MVSPQPSLGMSAATSVVVSCEVSLTTSAWTSCPLSAVRTSGLKTSPAHVASTSQSDSSQATVRRRRAAIPVGTQRRSKNRFMTDPFENIWMTALMLAKGWYGINWRRWRCGPASGRANVIRPYMNLTAASVRLMTRWKR